MPEVLEIFEIVGVLLTTISLVIGTFFAVLTLVAYEEDQRDLARIAIIFLSVGVVSALCAALSLNLFSVIYLILSPVAGLGFFAYLLSRTDWLPLSKR